MPRQYVVIRHHWIRNAAFRELSLAAQWLWFHLHFQSELSAVGTLYLNQNLWALGARGLHVNDINRALVELESGGWILTDSCTQELFITTFLNGRPPFRNRNLRVGTARVAMRVESDMLRAAIYEESPPELKAEMDTLSEGTPKSLPRAIEARSKRGRSDTDTDTDRSAVVRAFWQECAAPGLDGEDQDSRQLLERVQGATEELARRWVADAPLSRDLAGGLDEQWRRWGKRLADLARDFDGWTPEELADAIERGPFGA